MEGIITLVIIGFVLTFGSQLLKGIGNIFAASGRIGGWILGIILVLFLLKTIVFSPKPTEPGSFEHFNKQVNGKGTDNKDGTFTAYGVTVKWNGTEEDYEWVE